MTLTLNALRVLDLSRVLAGPLCTMTLGDMGAKVIKIEKPGSGDETRGWGPPFDDRGESAYYLSVNRNKMSATADLDLPADREFVLGLLAAADVVVDNFRRARSSDGAFFPTSCSEPMRSSSGARSPDSGPGATGPDTISSFRLKVAGCPSQATPTESRRG